MEQELKKRTKQFALRIMKMVDALPKNVSTSVIARQIVRSGTSIGANYRAACRGRSKAEFISKLGIVIEEADETCYWLELIIEGKFLMETQVKPLLQEANELTSIFVSSIKTAKKNLKSPIRDQKS